jgi:hypothetical protein
MVATVPRGRSNIRAGSRIIRGGMMNGIQLTRRGYRVATIMAALGFVTVMGLIGWLENLGA